MMDLIRSPYFVLFCATTAVAGVLWHRLWVQRVKPGYTEQAAAIIAALLSLSLSFTTYQIRMGIAVGTRIDASAATLVTALTGVGVAFVCLKLVLPDSESAE